MPILHLPESFALLRWLAKLWWLYSEMLMELYWLTILIMAAPSQEPTTPNWSEEFGQHWRRREEESCVVECCFTRTTHLFTHHLKNWLSFKMLDLNYFTTCHICKIWLQVTIICFLNWRNSWKEVYLLTTKTLWAWQMVGWKSMINNFSTMESEFCRSAGPSAHDLYSSKINK